MDFREYTPVQRKKLARLALFFAYNGPLGWALSRNCAALGIANQSLKAWLGVHGPGEEPPNHPNNNQMRVLATRASEVVEARIVMLTRVLNSGHLPSNREGVEGPAITDAQRTVYETEKQTLVRLKTVRWSTLAS